MGDRLTKEERKRWRKKANTFGLWEGVACIQALDDEIDALEAALDEALAREDGVRSRMYEARVECAERMRKIYEVLREEPFPWDDRDE